MTAVGNLKFSPTRFEATEIYAGSSVAGGTLDVVAGVVTAHTGTSVSVTGTTLVRNDGKPGPIGLGLFFSCIGLDASPKRCQTYFHDDIHAPTADLDYSPAETGVAFCRVCAPSV